MRRNDHISEMLNLPLYSTVRIVKEFETVRLIQAAR
jgi:hypothetical protein